VYLCACVRVRACVRVFSCTHRRIIDSLSPDALSSTTAPTVHRGLCAVKKQKTDHERFESRVAALGPFHPGAARGGEDARQRASAARRAHAITITMMATPVVLTEPQARADDSLGHPAPSDFLVRCKQVRFRQTRAAARDYCC